MDAPEAVTGSAREQISVDDQDIERRLQYVGFTDADVPRLLALAGIVERHVDEFVSTFFGHLAPFDEAAALLGDPIALQTARQLKREHLRAMVAGTYGTRYAQERLRLGMLYGQAALEPGLFLGAFHRMMAAIGFRMMADDVANAGDVFASFVSLKKIGFFDLSLIVDAMIFERERTIREQRERIMQLQNEALRELSTPVLQLQERLLLIPLISTINDERARQLTDTLLSAVKETRAKVVVLDITGVPVVDSQVARHLMQTISAARLMGAATIVTGVSTAVAAALTAINFDLEGVEVVGDLQRGLEEAQRLLIDVDSTRPHRPKLPF